MRMYSRRPRVEAMFFALYCRPLHPELFEIVAERRVERRGLCIRAGITPSGHVLSFSTAAWVLSELAAGTEQILPRSGRLLRKRFLGEQRGVLKPIADLSCRVISQRETADPEIFLHLHEEIVRDGRQRGLFFAHRPPHRLAVAPVSLIKIDAWQSTLTVNAFHTFPEEFAILKTQTLIESETWF